MLLSIVILPLWTINAAISLDSPKWPHDHDSPFFVGLRLGFSAVIASPHHMVSLLTAGPPPSLR
jgi:hypothetical protein